MQVVHEWNTAVHVQDAEGDPPSGRSPAPSCRRSSTTPTTRSPAIRSAGRKGWLPAFRDATLFKVAYGFGLRRNEARMLDVADFGRNPHATEFGDYGVCYVRHGKASKGSPPKRRSVLTVRPWTVEVLEEWVERVPARLRLPHGPALWPSERADAARAVTAQRTASPPTATPSACQPGWTSTRCAAPTSPT